MLPRITIAAILLTLAGTSQAQCQGVPRPGERMMESFSSLATVAGLPYQSGIELILNENGGRVEATLRDYAGDPKPRETKLTGTIKKDSREQQQLASLT